MIPAITRQISQTWHWKKRNHDVCATLEHELERPIGQDYNQDWIPVSQFPSEVHIDLQHKNFIPDPFVGFNEHKVQWIGEVEWLYKAMFRVEPPEIGEHLLLTFEGLDTLCDVFLNGSRILECSNMFRRYTYEISNDENNLSLLPKGANTLLLHFKSAKKRALEEADRRGYYRAGSVNLGDPSRLYLRKAQYDWRWDWGPELMTCGPYRPITLVTYSTRIQDFYPHTYTDPSISLRIDIELDGNPSADVGAVLVTLRAIDGTLVRSEKLSCKLQIHSRLARLDNIVGWDNLQENGVKLWWPFTYGNQVLYDVEVSILSASGVVLDSAMRRIGFRSVALIQERLSEPDQHGAGTSFVFEVNKVTMFIGGSNWIPADNYLTRITPNKYRHLLMLARDGNQTMVRVWGGGIYEPDIFYDICDELGILVWQDFQFACGIYPAYDEFVANVTLEAEQNVKRLRHHPCLALFCGNNEDYQMILQWGEHSNLPARKLYEEVFPEIVGRLTDPPLPYHRGSPYGGEGWNTADQTVGDVHIWDIWGGKELPYQNYDKMYGRLVSEFGLPSFPSMHTIRFWMGVAGQEQWHAQSQLMAQHIRAGSFERRFAIVMNENFKVTEDLETYAFRTQVMQAEGVGFAYRSWKQAWAGRGKEYCSGVLVWQLNDCWPVVSWAIIDYFMRPKLAYYTISRTLRSLSLHVVRKVAKNRANDRPDSFYEFGAFQSTGATLTIYAASTLLRQTHVTLSLSYFDLRLSSRWHEKAEYTGLIPTNQAVQLQTLKCPEPPADRSTINNTSCTVVVCARLLHPETRDVLARFVDWPHPFKYLEFPDPGLRIRKEKGGEGEVVLIVEVERPVKSLFFSVVDADERDWEVIWSDNNLDVVPGDPQKVSVRGLEQRLIQYAYLGSEKAKSLG